MKNLVFCTLILLCLASIITTTSSCDKDKNNNTTKNDSIPAVSGKLFINEVFSKSISGTVNDWVELYNASDSTLYLSTSFTLTDSIDYAGKFPLTKKYYINPKSFLVIECDGIDTCTDAIHTSFKLSSTGEQFAIYNGTQQIDAVTFPDMSVGDVSYARTTNGGSNWAITNTPTKGASNN